MKPLEPRLWALLDDACWLVFRCFGINAAPRLAGIGPQDRPWEAHRPWICQSVHEEWEKSGVRAPCRLARRDAALPRIGRCPTGLVFRTLPFDLGRGRSGVLLLGPYLRHPPRGRELSAMCARLGIPVNDNRRWAWRESPVLGPAPERRMLRFCRDLFTAVRDRYRGLARGASWEEATGVGLESVYPPLRLADDFPVHLYGVFVTYWELSEAGTRGKPIPVSDLEYIDRGSAAVRVNGRDFSLEQGQAVLSLPGDRTIIRPRSESTCETVSITFAANASLFTDVARRPLTFDAFQQTLLSRLCQIAPPRDEAAHRSSEAKLLLLQLLLGARKRETPPAEARPAMPAFRRVRQGAAVARIRNRLEEAPERPVRMVELAREARTSSSTLRRIFRRETGMSPIRYQQAARIRKSELLLSHSMLSVGQIAEQLGFSSPFHFSNAFKRVMGVSPTAFSRRMRSMRLQVERARALLREKRMPATETAHTLGFNTVEEFRRVFRHYNGVTPEEYAAGRPPVFSARPYGAPVERKEPRAATPVPARTGTS